MASPNTKRDKSKEYSDLYNTPEIALTSLFDNIELISKRNDGIITILEPCAGCGVISEYLRSKNPIKFAVGTNELYDHGYTTDWEEDFLTWTKQEGGFDYIITNPPYKLAKEFVLKGFEIAQEQYLFLRLDFLSAKNRYEDMFSLRHLQNVYVFISRVSCTEGVEQKETTNAVNYAWFHFNKEFVGQPTLYWI